MDFVSQPYFWQAVAAMIGLFATVIGPLVGLFVWMVRKEHNRSDKVTSVLENHFEHSARRDEEIIKHMEHTNTVLDILVQRMK